ncbi:universal stress protein [Opitutales bacterium ASA1]|uniref:universal stress protein n=1 Tax=Congregicoccus parvus TaxID=3081749 RepID=UPI002B2933B5|nr:universal stress protein [Opitutales bacterium ASA1]
MKRILVCTDGSAYAQVCCQYAGWLAGRTGAEVEVLYVTDLRQFEVPLIADLSGSLGIQPYQAILGQLQELEEKKAALILENATKTVRDAGAAGEVSSVHKTGLLVDCLTDHEAGADVVLLGKRGENANFATEHLGSTMERVVRASSRPCLVTSRAFKPVTRLLVAYDGGPSGTKALDFLCASSAFRGLETHVVVVAGAMDADTSLRHLREAETKLSAAGIKPVCQMLHGTAEDQISSYVVANDVNLLLMGAYGHSRIRYLVIGSTTTEMIRTCRIPVLLFR